MSHQPETRASIATDPDEMVAELKRLIAGFESGEISTAALRVFHADGTWEDIVLGGDEQDQAAILNKLR
jgi:hypothetical protein